LNTKTAGSQISGSVVWGIGMALHEETHVDHRIGRIMNANIAEYHVPVNADVGDIKVIFVRRQQSARHQGDRRGRHCRGRGGGCQRGLSRDGQARARSADYAG
jgi:CO/xanthine dehydrogenase Mo-binding subunit